MKMKNEEKKLNLKKQTVANLCPEEMKRLIGGTGNTTVIYSSIPCASATIIKDTD